jgi:DNA polymerase III delta prime subunit
VSGAVLGHDAVREHLRKAAAAGRLPHALLLTGPEGVGKRTVALELARDLLAAGDPAEAARFDRGAHDRFALFLDLDAPWPVRRADLLRKDFDEDALLAAYARLEEEGWIEGVAPGRGEGVVDLLRRNPEKLLGRRGIPFADVLEKEIAALERSKKSSADLVDVARAVFSAGTSRVFYRRSLGIELVNGKGDGEYFRSIASLLARAEGGGWRVAILDDAHKMTDQAQNAFLKTLEEPPRETLLVLVTSEPDGLLPTIHSRCARVVFDALPPASVERFLVETQGVPREEASILAVLSAGSPGKALALRGLDVAERRRVVEELLAAVAEGKLLECLALSGRRLAESAKEGPDGRDGRRDEARLLLDLLALGLRDLVLTAAGGDVEPLSGLDARRLAEIARRRSAEEWDRLFERTELALQDVDANVDPRFAVEALLVEAVPPAVGTA